MQNCHAENILEHLPYAGFVVKDYIITQLNGSAEQLQIQVGANIRELICIGSQEYDSFRSGKLYLQLNVLGMYYHACVSPYQDAHLFCILSEYATKELHTLSIAAAHLREPLQHALTGIEQLSENLSDTQDATVQESLGQLNKSIYRLIRSVKNMTDASAAPTHRPDHFKRLDACAHLAELAEKLQAQSSVLKRTFTFSGLEKSVYTMLDTNALDRGIYNLISNAVQFSSEFSTINMKVSTAGNRLFITIENNNPSSIRTTQFFDRYLRDLTFEDSRFGIGLGLSVARNVAIAHHGTLLVTEKNANTVSCTMTLAIAEESSNILRSPHMQIDQTGGIDPFYVELSDILPDKLYRQI